MLDYLDDIRNFNFKEEEKSAERCRLTQLEEHIKNMGSSSILLRYSMTIWMKMRDQMKSLWNR